MLNPMDLPLADLLFIAYLIALNGADASAPVPYASRIDGLILPSEVFPHEKQ